MHTSNLYFSRRRAERSSVFHLSSDYLSMHDPVKYNHLVLCKYIRQVLYSWRQLQVFSQTITSTLLMANLDRVVLKNKSLKFGPELNWLPKPFFPNKSTLTLSNRNNPHNGITDDKITHKLSVNLDAWARSSTVDVGPHGHQQAAVGTPTRPCARPVASPTTPSHLCV